MGDSHSVLITGCSTGIGRATAHLLRQRGYQVIATARNPDDVKQLQDQGFIALVLDVCDSDSIQAAVKSTLELTNGKLYGLVNNAGYGGIGAVEDLSRHMLRQQFETNVFGLIELSNLVLPVMRQQNSGRIVNLSSVLGLVSLPYRGAYNASKYAVEALTDALRMETQATGIKISLIEPGPISTQFRENAKRQFQLAIGDKPSAHRDVYEQMERNFKQRSRPIPFTLPPDAVAKKIAHALSSSRPKPRYYVTVPTYLLAAAKRFCSTRLLDRLLMRVHD